MKITNTEVNDFGRANTYSTGLVYADLFVLNRIIVIFPIYISSYEVPFKIFFSENIGRKKTTIINENSTNVLGKYGTYFEYTSGVTLAILDDGSYELYFSPELKNIVLPLNSPISEVLIRDNSPVTDTSIIEEPGIDIEIIPNEPDIRTTVPEESDINTDALPTNPAGSKIFIFLLIGGAVAVLLVLFGMLKKRK
ncbi:MAG: hypothetical protein LBU42_10105 [Prevotellaceae bacterium]|jgi:hypothetical protein|nr:hypothetical protein [Prevotellaceae bacterium]